jgi:hypothetical protein
VLRRAGFALKRAEIELGVPPKVVGAFDTITSVSEEEIDALVQESRDQRLTVLLLQTLYQASKQSERFQIGGFALRELAVEVGLLPVITLKLA